MIHGTMKKFVGIALSMVLAGTLHAQGFGPSGFPGFPPPEPGLGGGLPLQELDLTPAQEQQVKQILGAVKPLEAHRAAPVISFSLFRTTRAWSPGRARIIALDGSSVWVLLDSPAEREMLPVQTWDLLPAKAYGRAVLQVVRKTVRSLEASSSSTLVVKPEQLVRKLVEHGLSATAARQCAELLGTEQETVTPLAGRGMGSANQASLRPEEYVTAQRANQLELHPFSGFQWTRG
jgi:hypothetical protein